MKASKEALAIAGKCRWLDKDDVIQESHVIDLEAQRTWRPDGGASLATYRKIAIRKGLWKMVYRSRNTGDSVRERVAYSGDVVGTLAAPLAPLWADLVRHTLCFALAGDPIGRAVLLEGSKPSAVAKTIDVKVAVVYEHLRKTKETLKRNATLQRVWDMRPSHAEQENVRMKYET